MARGVDRMTIESFDADGRRHPPRREWWPLVFIAALIVVSLFGSTAITWLLDQNFSPGKILSALAAFVATTALFSAWEYAHQHRNEEN
jgi:uncharacterized membrane-anchored protein